MSATSSWTARQSILSLIHSFICPCQRGDIGSLSVHIFCAPAVGWHRGTLTTYLLGGSAIWIKSRKIIEILRITHFSQDIGRAPLLMPSPRLVLPTLSPGRAVKAGYCPAVAIHRITRRDHWTLTRFSSRPAEISTGGIITSFWREPTVEGHRTPGNGVDVRTISSTASSFQRSSWTRVRRAPTFSRRSIGTTTRPVDELSCGTWSSDASVTGCRAHVSWKPAGSRHHRSMSSATFSSSSSSAPFSSTRRTTTMGPCYCENRRGTPRDRSRVAFHGGRIILVRLLEEGEKAEVEPEVKDKFRILCSTSRSRRISAIRTCLQIFQVRD